MKDINLSLIIPAYNEEKRLPDTLEQALNFLKSLPYQFELIVVDNGSTDKTSKVVDAHAVRESAVRLIQLPQKGKGLAVKTGMLQALGEYRFMCDADLSMPIEEVTGFLPPERGADIVIGSREAPGARRFNEPHYRHLGGRGINLLIRLLALPDLHDTQCGFKCFKADAATDLFSRQTMDGWSFDIEILYIAKLRGYLIEEAAISWYYNPESKVSIFKDAIKMIQDIFMIRRNARKGLYN